MKRLTITKNFLFLSLILFISIPFISSRFLSNLYHTNTEIYTTLDNLSKTTCSKILSSFTLKDQETGNILKYYAINSQNPSISYAKGKSHKNTVVLLFGEHAREVISSELGLYIIQTLCSSQNKNESPYSKYTLKQILNQNNLIFIPIANEQGRTEIEKGNFCKRGNENDVDLNRNWDNHWDKSQHSKEEKPGSSPFSEWQTRLIRNILLQTQPTIFISTHSGLFSMYMPYGYKKLHIDQYDNKMKAMSQILNELNDKYCKCSVGTIADKLPYTTNGTEIDYAYETLGIKYTFAFEIYNGENNNKYFTELFKKDVKDVPIFDYAKFKSRNFLQMKTSTTLQRTHNYVKEDEQPCVVDYKEKVEDMFKYCIVNKNPLTKIEYDRTLINWTNVYFELFSMVFNKENSI
jgi:hypothetical protein